MAKASLVIAALAASSLGIDVPAVPTWPSGRCTDKSLTIPSWIISNYKVSDGTTTFRVDNRAADPTGLIADMECTSDGECIGTGNDELHAEISQSGEEAIVILSEVWVCDDAGDKIVFNASGNTTITQCSGTDCVSPIPYLVQGGLTLPIPLTPAQPSPPPGYESPSCARVGDDQWSVSDVSFKNYTKSQCKQWYQPEVICVDPPSDFIRKGLYLHLTITNNAIDHKVTCDLSPPQTEGSLPTGPLRCTGGKFNEITLDVNWDGSGSNFEVGVEELWYCLEDPEANAEPSVLVASGSTSLELDCSTTQGITGTADDIITTCTDPTGSHDVSGTQETKKKLPEFSLQTAYPVHGGCTFDSVVNPTWYMRGLFFETNEFTASDPDSVTLSRFTCGLTGPGFADYFFYQSNTLSGSGIDSVYDCNSYHDGKPVENHWNCSYAFDPFDKILSLDKVWKCDDKDKAHPLYFDGSGSFDWKKDPNYRCTATNPYVSCYWHDDLATLQPGVPYDIPKVTVSLVNVPPPRIETVRINGEWKKATDDS